MHFLFTVRKWVVMSSFSWQEGCCYLDIARHFLAFPLECSLHQQTLPHMYPLQLSELRNPGLRDAWLSTATTASPEAEPSPSGGPTETLE